MRLLVIIFFLYCSLANARVYSVQDLVNTAKHNSPVIKMLEFSVKKAFYEYKKAKYGFLLNPGLNFYVSPTIGKNEDGSYAFSDFSKYGLYFFSQLSGGILLYSFGKLDLAKEIASIGIESEELKKEYVKDKVVSEVYKLYYAYVALLEVEEIVKDGLKYYKKANDKLSELEEEDSDDFDQRDLFKIKIYEVDIKKLEYQVKTGKEIIKETIKSLTGIRDNDFKIKKVRLSLVVKKLKSLNFYVSEMNGNSFQMKLFSKGIKALKLKKKIYHKMFYPDFYLAGFLRGGYTTLGSREGSILEYDPSLPVNTVYGGLFAGFKMDLNIPKRIFEIKKIDALWRELEQKKYLYSQKLLLSVKKDYKTLKDGLKLLKYYKQSMKAARSLLISESNLYDNGFGKVDDLISALKEFYKRKLEYIQAISNFNSLYFDFKLKTGLIRKQSK